MSEKPLQIVEFIRPEVRVERPALSGDLAIFFGDFQAVTIYYDYRYTSNAGQYALAHVICQALGVEYPEGGDVHPLQTEAKDTP